MSEVALKTLRELRDRALSLLANVASDLTPFGKEDGTFRRKPDSKSPAWDINVTTTCSCLMALALTDRFREFYKAKEKDTANVTESVTPERRAETIFSKLLEAPWMSSGLTDNNAFTTALVLRVYGFLRQEKLLGPKSSDQGRYRTGWEREWDIDLELRDPLRFSKKLQTHADPALEFVWFSLSDATRDLIVSRRRGSGRTKLKESLVLDLRKLIQGGWIYEGKRFDRVSKATKSELREFKSKPLAYSLTTINRRLLAEQFPGELRKSKKHSLREIAELVARKTENFSINQYPPSPAIVYWFVDGVERGRIRLSPTCWEVLCTWAAKEFNHRRSLVAAEHDAMMDPVAMGMCACLCSRLRSISQKPALGADTKHLAILPSSVELERSIEELVSKQTSNGIWHKYFPLFHYQDAGSNFCFTFELLEAVLFEFAKNSNGLVAEYGENSNTLLANTKFVDALERSVTWCEKNRLSCTEGSLEYKGWNSGGQIETLEKGQPESWATAVIYMFLSELVTTLSERIQELILQKYKARVPQFVGEGNSKKAEQSTSSALNSVLDIDVLMRRKQRRLSRVLRTSIIEPYKSQTQSTLRRKAIKKPLSALLFGPPGTSKTEITRAVADELNWPLIEITPSEFVKGTLANVYVQADEIFDDLMDVSAVVIFFDEMDALVQTREGETQLDITSQFLTTTMLPKLTRLHDQARAIFFMATNFQERFDAAIKRPGRFDLLLCMGPPRLDEKLDRIHRVYGMDDASEQTKKAGEKITEYLKNDQELSDQLALFTFGEYKAFLSPIGGQKNIGDRIAKLGASGFKSKLQDYSQYVMLKLDELAPLRAAEKWKDLADLRRKRFTIAELRTKNVRITDIIRFFSDWQQSKQQY